MLSGPHAGQRRHITRRTATALIASAVFAAPRPLPAARATERQDRPKIPSRGFNLPGWVDRFPGSAPAPAVLEKLHRLGFRSVRLPVSADTIAGPAATDRAAVLGRIKAAVAELLAADYAVILSLLPGSDLARLLHEDVPAASARAAEAWTLLSGAIADLPAGDLYTELLNEPPLERPAWLQLRDRLAAIVRAGCAHTIVWGPARYQGIWELAGTPPLADRNSLAAIHYYTPMAFTHQCENWDSSPVGRLKNLPFPATRDTPAVTKLAGELRKASDRSALATLDDAFQEPWTEARIAADFAGVAEWSRKNDCPVILDEFGALGFCSDKASRANWTRAVRKAAEENGVGWAYWELDYGFGFIRDRKSTEGFDRAMIEALFG
jgi:endoglucanase